MLPVQCAPIWVDGGVAQGASGRRTFHPRQSLVASPVSSRTLGGVDLFRWMRDNVKRAGRSPLSDMKGEPLFYAFSSSGYENALRKWCVATRLSCVKIRIIWNCRGRFLSTGVA